RTLHLNDPRFASAESRFPALIPAGTQIYVQVDSANAQTSYGGVLETHEAEGAAYNNIRAITLSQAVSTMQWQQRPNQSTLVMDARITRP
ncbi:MAG: hypothetical protein HC853_14840, partial [Anaerolineae bacterium]|nr:hypothetical protein [Anaerolineae bacterium]